ncbi:zinc finger protein 19-like [Physeter macrocephalus]|uniref:Zinc finger protein 19-like n=1 Tax=Physeter macrocephalus TaxID=9755 RepID=A0A455ACN8_PHYMC|nr:zinc finger protein 19-like [Physeter catodon]|eukprot:XP_028334025.1 zinc finger protein 19-like [Physeter catodon]
MAIMPLKAWHKVSIGSLTCAFKSSDLKEMEDERGYPVWKLALISLLEGGYLPWGLETQDDPPAERTKNICKDAETNIDNKPTSTQGISEEREVMISCRLPKSFSRA